MPAGKVSSGDFRKGTPILVPHQFGTPVVKPEPQGNVIPQSNPTLDSNPVTWTPSPTHFGNQVGFSLQAVPPIVIVEQGGTGSTSIILTVLLGSPSATLTSSGAPVGVVVSFTTNPETSQSTAEITVGATVPVGKYTITVTGTSGTEAENTNIHLIVFNQSLPSNAFGFLLEDGSGVLLLEDGTILLLENQS